MDHSRSSSLGITRRISLAMPMLLMLLIGLAVAAHTAGADEEVHPYWVFFRDRGPASGPASDLLTIARSIPPATWARRARGTGGALPDRHDLPIWAPYVQAVRAHGMLRHQSRWLNAVSVDLRPADRSAVAQLPFVRELRPVASLRCQSLGPSRDAYGNPLGQVARPQRHAARMVPAGLAPQGLLEATSPRERSLLYGLSLWQLEEIGVPPVHDLGYSGNRVRFMMIDTGFRTDHDCFAQVAVLAERDFIFGDDVTMNEEEDHPYAHAHGTHTWGASGGFAPGILIGPGYGSSFVLAKTEDVRSETQVEEDYYVAALEWADSLGVALTSASLAYVCFDDGFCYEYEDKDGDTAVITIALDIAAARGITCVNCMGNYGCDEGSLGTPADADSIIAVGAVDSLNQVPEWTACGPTYDGRTKPEVMARGVHTFCADDDEVDSYGHTSGTSLSTPLVGGATALLLEAHPEWGPMDVREALLQTADRADMPDNLYGWGRIDVAAALEWTAVLFPRPFSLVSPADGAQAETVRPTFVWRASEDPDHGDPLDYMLWIDDVEDPGEVWCVPAGNDTSVTLPFDLAPDQMYVWEVTAEDLSGHRRISRETYALQGPAAGSVPPPVAEGSGWSVTASPNPFAEAITFRITPADGLDLARLDAPAQWTVYDPLGRRVAGGSVPRGSEGYSVAWDGRRADAQPVHAGVYYFELRGGHRVVREMIVRLGP